MISKSFKEIEYYIAAFFVSYMVFFSFFHRYIWKMINVPSTQHSFDVVGVIIPVLILLLILAYKKKDFFFLSLTDFFYLLFIFWIILSSFNVPNTAFAFKGGSRWVLLFITYYSFKSIFSIYKNAFDNLIKWSIFIFGIIAIASYFIGNFEILQRAFDPSSQEEYDLIIKSARSFMGFKNGIASHILLAMVVYICFVSRSGNRIIINGIYYLASILLLLVLQSRNVFLSLAIFSGLYFLIISNLSLIKNIQKDKVFKFILISTFLFVVFMIVDVNNYFASLSKNTTHVRLIMWKQSFKLLFESPLMGIGNFQWQMVNVFKPKLTHPHNDYVRTILELGLIGFVFYNAIYIVQFIKSWRLKLRENRQLTLLFMALFCFLTLGFFDGTLHRLSHCIFFMIILSKIEVLLFNKGVFFSVEKKLQALQPIFKYIVLVFTIGISIYPVLIYKNVVYKNEFKKSLRSKNSDSIENALNKIDFRIFPDNYMKPMLYEAGRFFYKKKDFDKAVYYSEESLVYYPSKGNTYSLLYKIYKDSKSDISKLKYYKALHEKTHKRKLKKRK